MNARQRVVRDLESAANHISEVPRRDLEILLRQAALLLRNIPEPLGEEWIPFRRSEDQDGPGAACEIPIPYQGPHAVSWQFARRRRIATDQALPAACSIAINCLIAHFPFSDDRFRIPCYPEQGILHQAIVITP